MQYRKLGELKELEGNPRIVKNREFKDLCESIKKNPKFFEARPLILSDRTGDLVIIAGNMKFKAAKENKLKEVPTELISGLTEELEREIIIRDNTHAGGWDFDLLSSSWADLPLADFGIDLPEDWLKDIPDENKAIDEEGMADTKNECPKCGFKW